MGVAAFCEMDFRSLPMHDTGMTHERSDKPDASGQREAKRFLLVTRCGRRSLHPQWLAPGTQRDYDVFLSFYEPCETDRLQVGVFSELRPGTKVAGYAGFLADYAQLLRSYDYVAFWDDDISADPATINRIFAIGARERLKLFQPALSADSFYTYAALVRQPGLSLRHVNFVEMMCPIFRTDELLRLKPLFDAGYESGMDLIWCNLLHENERDFAVLDETPVRHTLPVGGNKASNGFTAGRRYEDDIYALLERYDLPWFACVPYAARTIRGRTIKSRVALFVHALPILASIVRAGGVVQRARFVATHFYHLLRRKPANRRVEPIKPARHEESRPSVLAPA